MTTRAPTSPAGGAGGALLPTPTASNPNDGEDLDNWEARRQRNKAKGINGNGQGTPLSVAVRLWGDYGPAIEQHAAAVAGRPAPDPTENGRLSPRFVEWMMGLPSGWVTGVEGISRTQQLRMLGNGVVPQQAGMAYRQLLEAA